MNFYTSHTPAADLMPFVRRILVTDNHDAIDEIVKPGPTGYIYLGWIFRGRVDSEVNGEALVQQAGPVLHVAGQIRFQDITVRYSGPFGHILVEFTATGFHELIPVSASQGKVVLLSEHEQSWTMPFHRAEDALASTASLLDRIALFETFLRGLIPQARLAPRYVKSAVAMIEARNGLCAITDVAHDTGVSQRQLSRSFDEILGISPKYFARVIQLNHVIAAWQSGDMQNLTDLAHSAGFHDQAHLNHAISQFFGTSPQAFLDGGEDILFNFMGHSKAQQKNVM